MAKIPKRKKNERIEIMRPIRVAMAPACPNCGCKGAHYIPPVTWFLPTMTITEPGEFICHAGKPIYDAEIIP